MVVKKCGCKSEYQDKKYGNQNRVHNRIKSDLKPYRCTVCGNERA